MNYFGLFALLCVLIGLNNADTPVNKCPGGRSPEDYKQTISVGNCRKQPCRLRKGRSVDVEFKFTPSEEVKTLRNTVNAIIVGLPFPFIGVDGSDACTQLYEEDGTTKATCPLKAGTNYVYKNHFDILNIYPVLKLVVHWGLTANDGKDIMCFQLPAKITN